jgi:flagellar protein FliT
MEYQTTIALYESLAELTRQMLVAARQEDWELLTTLEKRCAQHVEDLKIIKESMPLPTDDYARKVASIKSILKDDREIRNLVSPWMVRLNSMIYSNQTEQKLGRTYGN